MANNKFETIERLKKECFYSDNAKKNTLRDNIRNYNNNLREKIDPELYIQYALWQADIYVDVFSIVVTASHVYPQLTEEQILSMLEKNREERHYFIYN